MKKPTPFTITLVVLLFVFAFDYLKLNESFKQHSEEYLNESILLATSTYATSRVINAGVSTLQESTITMSPWGVGITVPPGQILDPINYATERLSDLAVQSIGLLGVQRILLEVINRFTIIPLYLGLFLLLLLVRFTKQNRMSATLLKFVLLLALLRISTPVMCSIGIAANNHYFKPAVEESLRDLTGAKKIVSAEFKYEEPRLDIDWSDGQELGPIDTIKLFFTQMVEAGKKQFAATKFRFKKTREAIGYLNNNSLDIIKDLTNLFAAILGKIAVQVFLLPLVTLALIRWIFKQVTDSSLDDFVGNLRSKLSNDDGSHGEQPNNPLA